MASIDRGAHALGADHESNYVHLRNTGRTDMMFTAETADCVNLGAAECGTALDHVRIAAGAQAGFWVNSGRDGPWSSTVQCTVGRAAAAQCGAGGGQPAPSADADSAAPAADVVADPGADPGANPGPDPGPDLGADPNPAAATGEGEAATPGK